MKSLILCLSLLSTAVFANTEVKEELCSIDYASMNYVQSTNLIQTESDHLIIAMEKVQGICNKSNFITEKSISFVYGYFDGYQEGTDEYQVLTSKDIDDRALVHVCVDTINRLKDIQINGNSTDIALEVEAALYNTQKFCRIAENQSGYLAGYMDGTNDDGTDYSIGYEQ